MSSWMRTLRRSNRRTRTSELAWRDMLLCQGKPSLFVLLYPPLTQMEVSASAEVVVLMHYRQLSTEQAVLQESLQKESKVNKRLSMENEELLWKLHNGDLGSPRKVSPTSTSPFHSPSHSFSFQWSWNVIPLQHGAMFVSCSLSNTTAWAWLFWDSMNSCTLVQTIKMLHRSTS